MSNHVIRGPRCFRFEIFLLSFDSLDMVVCNAWSFIGHYSPRIRLTLLNNVQHAIRCWKCQIGHLVHKWQQLYDQTCALQLLEAQFGMLCSHLCNSILAPLIEYQNVLHHEEVMWYQKYRAI